MNLSRINVSRSLATIPETSPASEAVVLMDERRVRHLPVTDARGDVVGMISDRDLKRSRGLSVKELMSSPALTVDENASLVEVTELLLKERVSSLLVTRGKGELVGIVTTDDLLRHLAEVLGGEKGGTLKTLPYAPVITEAMRELSAAGI